jgi:phosphoribosylaminoimidazolecarboxamide formyltransferase/IMP cyclohydrolase
MKKIIGGYLLQEPDDFGVFSESILGPDTQTVTKRKPSGAEMDALRLAWIVAKNCKSNSVVIANQNQTLGIGCGQVNRMYSSRSAAFQAQRFQSEIKVCASDGFFPFADSIKLLKDAGVTAIVQPGGSIRDPEVIEACEQNDIAMIFTKVRHFSH